MTDRERLLEILNKPIFPHEMVDPLEAVSDYLLDNGVTFANDNNVGCKWIPVTERLPERGQEVIVFRGGYLKPDVFAYHFWSKEFNSWKGITHWMPMPEMPKEE